MERYDDRPISVYDNLNTPTTTTTAMHTNTPKSQTSSSPTTSTKENSTALATVNGATRSPIYSDISFKFNDSIKPHHQQQQQQQQQQQLSQQLQSQLQMHLLPNGNQSLNQNQQQQQTQPASSQVHPNYASPFKSSAMNTTKATTPIPVTTPQTQQIQQTATATAALTATNTKANPAKRPLSQHSQAELNEASQSIAAVKAALNDAKSKFFGLNGYAQDSSNSNISNQYESQIPPETKVQTSPARTTSKPTPPPKPQPKYQNIPENSAIFRKQPPELPPKPTSSSPLMVRREPSPASTPQSANSVAEPQMPQTPSSPTEMSATAAAATAPSPATPVSQQQQQASILPYSAYKQIPLNDIDIAQPSQAVYMSTTVPQNIKGSKIAGRHTPTRNSLRHSRMLVVNNKNYQGIQHPNPMNFKYPNFARWLLILEIIIGLLISFLAIWIFCLAPNTAIQNNPYWSGLALLFAGILGLVLIRYQRIKRHKVRENCFIFLRADSYLLSLIAVLLCSVALICATIHFARLTASDTKCVSTNILLEHGSCTCTFNSIDSMSSIAPYKSHDDTSNGLLVEEEVPDAGFEDRSYKVEYRDLSCKEVNGAWIFILELTIAFNAIGFLVAILYIALLACYRHNSKRFYSSVHTSSN